MARPILRDKSLEKVNLMLDRDALAKAQARAIRNGAADVATAGNASAFVRWLIDNYNGNQHE